MEFHPVANIFPLLQGEEYEQLKADIVTNGLIEPIWLHPDGRIIDGRNRWRACVDTNTNAKTRVWDGQGSLISFVVSLNLHRRHLDSSQRAAVAVEVLPLLEEEARARQGQRNDLTPTSVNSLTEVHRPQRATQEAAEIFHTNRQYVSDAKKIKEDAPDLFEQVRNGEVNIPEAKRQMSQPMGVFLSHKETEWYTPPEFIEAARLVMGGIDLDPASCEEAQKNVKAACYYTETDNGLSQEWFGRVWLNPPYSKTHGKSNQELWAQRLISEYRSGTVKQAILLVKSALGYRWFEELWDILPVCFLRQRPSFIKSTGTSDGESKHGIALFYVGNDLPKFIEVFSQFGRITTPGGDYIAQRGR